MRDGGTEGEGEREREREREDGVGIGQRIVWREKVGERKFAIVVMTITAVFTSGKR